MRDGSESSAWVKMAEGEQQQEGKVVQNPKKFNKVENVSKAGE